MNTTEINALYGVMFMQYPDVVNISQLCEMLGGISEKTAYRLIREGKIGAFLIGRAYCIPKANVIDFLHVPGKSVC